jgi:acyl-CoA reductase-like NAD-dependent aldehyde dehydrogenase
MNAELKVDTSGDFKLLINGELVAGASSFERAYEVALKIDSGTVWVNKHLDLSPEIPFTGAKQSGHGTEMGQEGLEEFTQAKVINIAR